MKKKLLALAIVLAIVAAMIVPMAVLAAGPIYVAATGNDANLGTSSSPFLTIGHAVSAAASGDTINVAAGTYTEPTAQILISKNLTIVGAGATTTILKPSADTGTAGHIASLANGWFAVSPGFTFNLSNVTLDGTGHVIGAGVLYDQASGTVNNCTLENIQSPPYLGMGIAAYNGGVDNTAPTAPTNVNVTNCTFSGIGRIGIYFYAAAGELTGTINGNTYTGKGAVNGLDYFVDIEGGTVTISNNTVTGCLGVATIDNSTSAGILVTTYRNSGTTATITGNTVFGNSYGINVGIDANDLSSVTANNNNIAGNVTDDFANTGANYVDATNNWWGTAVQSAIAALVTGNVHYIPYLNNAPGSTPNPPPSGGPVGVTGNWVAPTVTFNPTGSNIALGQLYSGWNPKSGYDFTGGYGSIAFAQNSDTGASCSLSVSSTSFGNALGEMYNTNDTSYLSNPMAVELGTNTATGNVDADGGTVWTTGTLPNGPTVGIPSNGNTYYFDIGAAQQITTLPTAGAYVMTISVAAGFTP